jgi:NAD(P)-dependent dehydrogenase (short-subunit alcohol dehydrogenase family)
MLKDKKILVTGAGGLLGGQVVHSLLSQNAVVLATDNHYEKMKENLINKEITVVDNPNLIMFSLDVINDQEVIAFFNTVGELDGAVNCTYPRNAMYGRHFFDVTLDSFNDNVSLHLGSSFLFSQQCAAYFLKNKRPFSLVNISSIYGVVAPEFDIYTNTSMTTPVEYAAIKSALIHLNKYIASYMSDSNFRINSVSPGGIFDHQPDEFLDRYKRKTLGKGMLDASDITGAVIFLLSEHSRYINGQNLIVDDGFSL